MKGGMGIVEHLLGLHRACLTGIGRRAFFDAIEKAEDELRAVAPPRVRAVASRRLQSIRRAGEAHFKHTHMRIPFSNPKVEELAIYLVAHARAREGRQD